MRNASPSIHSSAPSRFWRNVAGLPTAMPYWKPSLSCRTVSRSARSVNVPCVSTTLPSNTATCFTSSAIMRSDSILTGFSRSARSARAESARTVKSKRSTARHTGSSPLAVVGATDACLEFELAGLVVVIHSDPAEPRRTLEDDDAFRRARDVLFREQLKVACLHSQFGVFGCCFATYRDISVKLYFVALLNQGSTIGRDVDRRFATPQLDEPRLVQLRSLVVGEVSHLARGERRFRTPGAIEARSADALDDEVGLVSQLADLCPRRCVDETLQPKREHRETGRQGKREEGISARLHARYLSMAASSRPCAARISSHTSRTAPCPAGRRLT